MCDEYCKGCKYVSIVSSEYLCCNYFLMTSVLRGCPAGKGCTRKVSGSRLKGELYRNYLRPKMQKRPEPQENKERKKTMRLQADENSIRLSLYNEGHTDVEIAEMRCVCRNTIRAWRERRGLQSQKHRRADNEA